MNKPEFYPYVLLPEEIEKIKIEGIPVPEIEELPSFPIKPKKKFLGTIILILSLLVIILVNLKVINLGYSYNNMITYLAFFVAIVSLTATVFEILQNGKSKKQFKIAIKLYNELKIEQEQIKEIRNKVIDDNNNPKAIEIYRHDAINKYFRYSYNKIQAVQREHSAAQSRFMVFLEQYFEGKILENIRIFHEPKGLDYSPNFVIKLNNPKVNIAIDIEVPYLLEGTKVIVKKNKAEESFSKRYRITNELRWVSITFSEEQIVSLPMQACKLIAHTIDEILLKEKYSPLFNNVEKIKRAEIPGQRELSTFIRNKHREKYLIAAGLIDELSKPPMELEKINKELKTLEEKEKKTEDKKEKEIIEEKKEKQLDEKKEKTLKLSIVKKSEDKTPVKKRIIDLKAERTFEIKEEKEIVEIKKTVEKKELEVEQLQIVKKVTEQHKNEKLEKEKNKKLEAAKNSKKQLDTKELESDKKAEQERNNISEKKITTVSKKGQLRKEAEILNKLYGADEKEPVDINSKQADKNEQQKNIEKEKRNKEFQERERIEKEKLETKRLEKIKLQKESLERLQLEKEKEEQKRIEEEGLVKENEEEEKLEQERLEKERIKKEKEEQKRLEKEQLEKIRHEKEKLQKELDKKAEIEANNNIMEQHKIQIEAFVSNQEWNKLLDKCNAVISKFPYWAWPYYRRSTVHGNKGKFDEVLEDCNKALALNPKLSDAYYNRATAKFFQEKYQDAANDYQKCIDLKYENSVNAYFNRGLCYQNLGYNKKAFREFLKAKDLGSGKAIKVINEQFSNSK